MDIAGNKTEITNDTIVKVSSDTLLKNNNKICIYGDMYLTQYIISFVKENNIDNYQSRGYLATGIKRLGYLNKNHLATYRTPYHSIANQDVLISLRAIEGKPKLYFYKYNCAGSQNECTITLDKLNSGSKYIFIYLLT
jgi:hypothetical protein